MCLDLTFQTPSVWKLTVYPENRPWPLPVLLLLSQDQFAAMLTELEDSEFIFANIKCQRVVHLKTK